MDCGGEGWAWLEAVDCVGEVGFGSRLWIVGARVGVGARLWIVSARLGLERGCGLWGWDDGNAEL